jgi:orotate phosphoribosyltransferase
VLNEKDVRALMEETQALLTGHFRLSSGRHSRHYFQCARVLQYPGKAEQLGRSLAALCGSANEGRIDLVASPALGGTVLGQEVARGLGVRHIFAERDASRQFSFRRGFHLKTNERVLLVDDVFTTGGSLKELADVVQAHGAQVIGLAALVERGVQREKQFVAPRYALLRLDLEDYDADACPACRDGVPVEKPGSRPDPV